MCLSLTQISPSQLICKRYEALSIRKAVQYAAGDQRWYSPPKVGIVIAVLFPVVWGALLTGALVVAETLLGWPSSIRMFLGGIAVFLGSALSSGGSGRTLYEKGAIRRIEESDIREYKSTRQANISTGISMMICGAVIFASIFLLP